MTDIRISEVEEEQVVGRLEVAEFTSLKNSIDALRMMTIIKGLNK